jgi:hypothetical protein
MNGAAPVGGYFVSGTEDPTGLGQPTPIAFGRQAFRQSCFHREFGSDIGIDSR